MRDAAACWWAELWCRGVQGDGGGRCERELHAASCQTCMIVRSVACLLLLLFGALPLGCVGEAPSRASHIQTHLALTSGSVEGSRELWLLLLLGVALLLLPLVPAAGCHTTSSKVPSGAVQVVWMSPSGLVEVLAASDARAHRRTPHSCPLPTPAAARLSQCLCLHSGTLTAATLLHGLLRPALLQGTTAVGRCTCGWQRGTMRIRVACACHLGQLPVHYQSHGVQKHQVRLIKRAVLQAALLQQVQGPTRSLRLHPCCQAAF
jgi:hypothetical protein